MAGMDTAQVHLPNAEWLAAQTKVIEGWKAEDAAFASYCSNRDMGIKPDALARFFTPYWSSDFERRYQYERRSA